MSNESPPNPEAAAPPVNIPSLWGAPNVIASPTPISPSAAGDNVTLLFEDFSVELNTKDKPLSGFAVVNLTVPITLHNDKQFLGYCITIDGFIFKDKSARATVSADVAGALKTLEYTYDEAWGTTPDGENGRIFKSFFSIERRAADWQYENGQRPAIGPVALTLTITGQRISTTDSVVLKIDGIAIEAIELPA